MTDLSTQPSSQKIALITGGSRGLGRSAALKLAERGVGVVLTYHSKQEKAEAVVREIEQHGAKAVALRLDVARLQTFNDFMARLDEALEATWQRQQFDFLVNNAGFGVHSAFAETSEEDFDALVNVHFKGVFFLTQHMLPRLADGGRIVNISTGLARFVFPGYAAYAAMKGAIEVLTRYLAKELGPRSIAVNTIAPGAVETDFGGGVVRDDEQINQYVASSTAMGRAGLPGDIGGAVASLLTGENHWVTGQRIEVSGGQSL